MKKFFVIQISVFMVLFFTSLQSVFAEDLPSLFINSNDVKVSENVNKEYLEINPEFKENKVALADFPNDFKPEKFDEDEENPNEIADPLYYFNYGMFHFNDFLQNYALEPVATGYKYITPEVARVGVGNFFDNLKTPVYMVNNLLQFNFKNSSLELLRFVINCTIGVAGFYDAADNLFDLKKHEANFGQTLGYYGIGHGFYIVWPILGPSSPRETVGFAGDQMMSPSTYLGYLYLNFYEVAGINTFEKVNETSFKLGNYKLLVNNGVDPYSALKDAFEQYTMKKVKKVKQN